jgi:hypothetical protein
VNRLTERQKLGEIGGREVTGCKEATETISLPRGLILGPSEDFFEGIG